MGGAEIMILNFLKSLDNKQFHPSVCSLSKDGVLNKAFIDNKVPVYELAQKPGIDIFSIYRLYKLLKKHNIRILHTHNFFAWFYGSLTSLLIPKLKVIHTQHSDISRIKRPNKIIQWLMLNATSHIVTVSKEAFVELSKTGLFEKNKTSTIYNGIQCNNTTASARGDNTIHIGIVARLADVKNHSLLLKATKLLSKKNTDFCVDIIGDGPKMTALVDEASDLGIASIINFHGEINNASSMMSLFDIYVLCSLSEGLSISILEAMANSLPIVATDVGGNSTLVENEYNGFIIKSDDAAELARKIEVLLLDRKLRSDMGSNSLRKVESDFSMAKMIQQYTLLYDDAVE